MYSCTNKNTILIPLCISGRGIVTLTPLQQGDFVTYYHGRHVDAVPDGADDSYFFEVDMKNEAIW